MAETVESEMRRFLSRWQESGQSLRQFAIERGVPYSRAQYWRRKLGPGDGVAPRLDLVEVALVDPAPRAPSFELSLGGLRTIRVPADFDAHALKRLVEVLEQC